MSTMVDRQKAHVEELIAKGAQLTELIESLGIKVPHQRAAQKMMEAIRIGLPPSASWWAICFSWRMRDRANRHNIHWCSYEYDVFKTSGGDKLVESAHIPSIVQNEVALIRAAIPEARIYVQALKKDPWYSVERYSGRHGLESVTVRGWDGDEILL
jgi:hypothetical protein